MAAKPDARAAMQHHHAKDARHVACAVLTISDTRTAGDDLSGGRIRELLTAAGHEVVHHSVVPDEEAQIRWAIHAAPRVAAAVLLTGGTGLSPRDVTYEVVTALLDKEISGFGELFRQLSYAQVGAAAMLSRAVAGVAGDRLLFALPGSRKAVELAMEALILPQLGHMAGLVRGPR